MKIITLLSIVIVISICLKANHAIEQTVANPEDILLLHGFIPIQVGIDYGQFSDRIPKPSFHLEMTEKQYKSWKNDNILTPVPERSYKEFTVSLKECETLLEKDFDMSLPTVMYIDQESGNQYFYPTRGLLDGFMKRGDHNLLYLGWEEYNDIITPIIKIEEIADSVSKCIDKLVNKNLDLKQFHMIGFSVGGLLVGLISSRLKTGKPRRITALNPLNLSVVYQHFPYGFKFNEQLAEFVDVIHTSRYPGIIKPMGHIDYYVNGGEYDQPGCQLFKETVECNHTFAVLIFNESIHGNPRRLLARNCNSYRMFLKGKCNENETVQFGFPAKLKETGKYYILTNSLTGARHVGKGKEGATPNNKK